VIDRVEHRDVLRCEVVTGDSGDVERLAALVKERIRSALRFEAEVVVVDDFDSQSPPIVDLRSWE